MATQLRIRVRGPQGVSTITAASDATWTSLLQEIREKTGVIDFDLKTGYPPQPLDSSSITPDAKLGELPFKLSGEQLIVTPIIATETGKKTDLQDQTPLEIPPAASSKPLSLTRKSQPSSIEPPTVPVPALDGTIVLRVMPDDNSCLFRAISSAVLGASLDGMTELRSMVAQTIISQPDIYTTAVLEKPPADYCRWIQQEDSWGGGIELAILSQAFDVEICSINVQDLRVDRFNEGRPNRCILVYSGIHYDVCALEEFTASADDGELDRKIFSVLRLDNAVGAHDMEDEVDGGALKAALELCKVLQQQHYFTDPATFKLRCNVCRSTGSGQRWASQHAEATGHGDFGEGE